MKRILLILVVVISIGNNVNAQDGTGFCILPDGENYAQVNFYKSTSQSMGHFNVSSDKPLATLKIIIQAEIKNNMGGWDRVTLYNDTLYDIPKRQTKAYDVKMPYYVDIKNITVSVGNPKCKSE